MYAESRTNPACTRLEVEWLDDIPLVASVTDIPNDQGRQVSLSWTRSGYDVAGSFLPITEYAVYRRIDYEMGGAQAGGYRASLADGLQMVKNELEPQPLYPPGDWHFIMTVPACLEHEYAIVVPTLADSTISQGMYYTFFFVRALTGTPGTHFDSYPDSGYSIDNLAPAAPASLEMPSSTDLVWEESAAEDFDYFSVYGSAAPALDGTAVCLGHTIGTAMDITGHHYDYYHVTATDFSGNEGDASTVENDYAGLVAVEELPTVFALGESDPNPFRRSTTIRFDVPRPDFVSIKVYDGRGRLVRTLSEGDAEPGRHSVTWAGVNRENNPVGPGVYFIKMDAAGFSATNKATILP
jgi:hypothetical protein